MKKMFAASAVALILCLTACSPDPGTTYTEPKPFEFVQKTVYLSDGRTVVCLLDDEYYPDLMSCDWESAR